MVLEMRRGYRPDHSSIGKFIRSEQARQPAIEVAEDIMKVAIANTPVDTGDLAESYRVNRHPPDLFVKPGGLRAIAEVVNDSDHAAAVEFGNKRSRKRRMLGKAGALFGDFIGTKTGL